MARRRVGGGIVGKFKGLFSSFAGIIVVLVVAVIAMKFKPQIQAGINQIPVVGPQVNSFIS